VQVDDRGSFLFVEHDDGDAFGGPDGKGYGLVDEVIVVREF
jgi:hypothetical protein